MGRWHEYANPASSALQTHFSTSDTRLQHASGASACGLAEWPVRQGGSTDARLWESRAVRWVATWREEGEGDERSGVEQFLATAEMKQVMIRLLDYHAYSISTDHVYSLLNIISKCIQQTLLCTYMHCQYKWIWLRSNFCIHTVHFHRITCYHQRNFCIT